jgi:hypothetical protein
LQKMRRRPLARLSTWYTYPPKVSRSGLGMARIVLVVARISEGR